MFLHQKYVCTMVMQRLWEKFSKMCLAALVNDLSSTLSHSQDVHLL